MVLIDTVLSYQNARAAGTGMVLTEDGQILTNYHVVEGATSIKVTVATTGKTYTASVVGTDKTRDVALLQLEDASGLTTAKIDDDQTAVGDAVTAVGNAGGTGTLTAAPGTITGLDTSLTAGSEGSGGSETLHGMIETDADVVAGDSGGPLVDAQGEVIGIDTAASSGGAIDGYAIPIHTALQIVDQIRSGNASGTVRVGTAAFLGVQLSDGQSQLGSSFGQSGSDGTDQSGSGSSGAVIAGVVDGSAAADAGLQAGDVVTAVDGKAVSSPEDVSSALASAKPGDKVEVTYTDQSGSEHTVTATLGSSPVA